MTRASRGARRLPGLRREGAVWLIQGGAREEAGPGGAVALAQMALAQAPLLSGSAPCVLAPPPPVARKPDCGLFRGPQVFLEDEPQQK